MKGKFLLAALVVAALTMPAAGAARVPQSVSTFTWSKNLSPRGESPHPNPAPGVFNSDLAFWDDRAYQGTYDGFHIIDIDDPKKPRTLIDYNQCNGNQGDVVVWDTILVRSWNSAAGVSSTCGGDVVLPGFEGLHVFDVSNPADPQLVASVQLPCGSHTASGVPDLANNRLLIYNSGSSANCPWFDIVSVPLGNPAAAGLLGVAPAGRACHDTSIILGDEMLASCAGGNGFTVFSIGAPRGGSLTAPVQLYSKQVTGVTIAHSSSFSWDGEVLVFGHEPGGGSGARCQETSAEVDRTLFFYDADTGTELGRWVLTRFQTAAENCTIHNFNVVPTEAADVLVSGNYQAGIIVIDFTNPASPKEIAYADPAPLSPQQLGGDWSSYWYDDGIFESDITRGLITWKLNDKRVKKAIELEHLNPQTQEFTLG